MCFVYHIIGHIHLIKLHDLQSKNCRKYAFCASTTDRNVYLTAVAQMHRLGDSSMFQTTRTKRYSHSLEINSNTLAMAIEHKFSLS